MPDLPGIVSDRYEIEKSLGQGGMGTVYLGRDRVLARPVAVKLLPAEMASDEDAAERLGQEARFAARLNHPKIVSVFDAGVADGIPYLVMEHVDGHTLAEELRSEGPLPLHRATTIAAGIAEALAAAHDSGMIHRDVKPSNVMLTSSGEVKVTDFGVARAVEDTVTSPSAVVGSAPYLAPEQARGEAPDPRSDLYGLGVVLYEMLAGRPPFEADSPVAVAFKHLEEDPEPPSTVRSDIPPELDRIVMTALAKDPADRYGSADAFLAALQDSAVGPDTDPLGTVTATPKPADTFAAAPPARSRARWVVRAAVVVAAMVAAVTALTLWRITRSPGQAPGGEENPRPSVSSSSAPLIDPSTVSSPTADPAAPENQGREGENGGSSGSSEQTPPTTQPTGPPSPSPEASPPPPSPSPPPSLSPSPGTTP